MEHDACQKDNEEDEIINKDNDNFSVENDLALSKLNSFHLCNFSEWRDVLFIYLSFYEN